jgi:hypothetical protein
LLSIVCVEGQTFVVSPIAADHLHRLDNDAIFSTKENLCPLSKTLLSNCAVTTKHFSNNSNGMICGVEQQHEIADSPALLCLAMERIK